LGVISKQAPLKNFELNGCFNKDVNND